ncbi:MscS family mechanosensitive ion channel [hydrothermal vent metagenome]|uniref:MscS family mechanosensitive ion channel n=1 Tax=hydrothermal vent metagenome TaxID=652676 RepID=A0A1W1BA75_9ZZZZ
MSLRYLLFVPLIFLSISHAELSAEEGGALKHLENIKEIITAGLSSKKDEAPKDDKKEKNNHANKWQEKRDTINLLLKRKRELDESLKTNNIWSKVYSNYHTYLYLIDEQKKTQEQIETLENRINLTSKEKEGLSRLKSKAKTIAGKLQLLEEYKKDPFKELIKPMPLEEIPSVTNPIAIITAMSYKKKLLSEQDMFNNRYISLKQIVDKFQEESKILEELIKLDGDNEEYIENLKKVNERLKIYKPVLDIFTTTKNVYTKKVDEIKLKLNREIKREMSKAAAIGGILLFFFAIFLLGKFLAHRYMAENDRFYMINKILNITFITLLVVIILFSYIENVSYLVTVLGFASAGIAIAMKDWFMSLMGWFVIIIGGTIHVGDRVKFVKDGVEYVGDIVDISVMRMTLHEDVTLTTYMHNRRGGRMIFIPNNFIFTDMIANYSHSGLKTVWDGIDFVITFDSDISKASSIAKEVTKKYSKGYTDITRKQLNKLRSSYSIRNTNVEPRILSFIEPYGVKISSWYLTNAYATLTLRSTISQEIIERIQAEESVHLAFPTQSIYVDKDVRKPPIVPEDIESDDEVVLS